MQKIVVTGADGRMGRAIIEAVLDTDAVVLVGALVQSESAFVGIDAGELIGRSKTGVVISDNPEALFSAQVTVIDFTAPVATLNHLALAEKTGARLVIGTTGFTAEELATLTAYGSKVSAVFAGNYSVGVNLSLKLLRLAAQVMGENSDIEVIEAHHKNKVDAPSGTALMMGQAVAEAMSVKLDEVGVFAREGITGVREPGSIGFSTIRGGDIVGEHTVMFCAEGERIEITHKANSRQTFARGAVRAASWLDEQRKYGIFSMEDVLGL